MQRLEAGQVDRGQTITVTVTGHGLKDIDTALDFAGARDDVVVDAVSEDAAKAAGLVDTDS